MGKTEHVVMGNNSLRCLNCGDESFLNMSRGLSINMMLGLSKGFSKDHARCKPTARGRERFEYTTPGGWLKSWDTGQSSLTIYGFMDSGRTINVSVPHDPADFGRCYRLLKVAPAWRARMWEMGAEIPAWSKLCDAWSELETLFEEESPSGECPKLYARIQELGR